MKTEVVVFVACCRELFPILDLVDHIGDVVGLKRQEWCKMQYKVHKVNVGALTLLTPPTPPQFTHHSKHYAIKTNWVYEQIIAHNIKVMEINIKEQLGGIFNKLIPEIILKYCCKKIMGL